MHRITVYDEQESDVDVEMSHILLELVRLQKQRNGMYLGSVHPGYALRRLKDLKLLG